MTEKQFEALKAWIDAMRDADLAHANTKRFPGVCTLEAEKEAREVLARAEAWARLNLVED